MIIQDNNITQSPLVTVQVYAYNKEKYIRECLDTVLNQKTNFEYEVLISENPGTDKTREICLDYQKKYPKKIILVLREENMGFFYNYYAAERMSRGKYIARCDADDYWCDTQKLQKQVDFLETHPDYGYCYTRSRVYNNELKLFENKLGGLPWKGFKSELLLEPVQQPSVMYRRELFLKYLEEIKPDERDWLMEDMPRTLWFAWNSKVARLDDITAVYRVVKDSMSHLVDYKKQEKYHKSILDIRLFYYNRYCPGETDLIIPLYNDYYRRNINAAYQSLDFKNLMINMRQYKYSSVKEVVINMYILFRFCLKRFFTCK